MSTNNKLLEESLVEAYVLYNWSYDSIVADYPNIEEKQFTEWMIIPQLNLYKNNARYIKCIYE